jgi:hypothetical protein
MFVAKSQNVRQYWCSAEKSNGIIALLMVSRFSGAQFGFAVEDTF